MDNAIEIKNLTKKYKDFILEDISINIPKGTIVGIVGENGAGKSTFINAILGIVQSQYQKLSYFGKDFHQYEKEIKEDLAVIFETSHYDVELTAQWIDRILSHTYRNWNHELYLKYLKQFDIPYHKKLKFFSRGMKMKLEFAIAFSHDAKLLILDEATSGLDPIIRDEILDLIRDFTEDENHTVIMSSHITSDLDKIADYIVYIHQGKCLFMQTYDDMKENYGIIHGNQNLLDTLSHDDIVSYITEPYSVSILIQNRQQIQEIFKDLEISRPTIEEIMLFYAKGVKKMLGIMIKDCYESFFIKKNLIGMIISSLCLIAILILMKSIYSMILIVVVAFPMIGISILQYSMEQDEISKYDKILLTFPITKEQIVQAKFISTILFTLFVQLCLSLPIVCLFTGVYHVTSVQNSFFIWMLGFILSFIMNSLTSIGFFWLGSKKGTVVYMIFVITFSFAYIILHFAFTVDYLLSLPMYVIIIIGSILAIILNIISYLICVSIYKRKHS